MKTAIFLTGFLFSILFSSCEDQPSLQRYYVDNQSNKNFVAIDIPASMFANTANLDAESQRALKSIRKINFLAVPRKEETLELIALEQAKISEILKNEKYQLLMKYGSDGSKVEIYYTGSEEAVDEVVVYGYADKSGMGIARLLGKAMNPGDILRLMQSLQAGDAKISGLEKITELFTEKVSEVPAEVSAE